MGLIADEAEVLRVSLALAAGVAAAIRGLLGTDVSSWHFSLGLISCRLPLLGLHLP